MRFDLRTTTPFSTIEQALGSFRVTTFPHTTDAVQYDAFGLRGRSVH
jgi:hypothetical protein